MAEVVKCGFLNKHSNSFLSGGWVNVWLKLYKDSNLVFYKKQNDTTPKGRVCLKDVSKWFAVGRYTEGMPDRPDLPKSGNIDYTIAIPQKPSSKSKIHWLLCANETEFNEWMSAIISTLPPLPHKSASAPNFAPQPAPVQQAAPPPLQYPQQPPPPYPGHSGQAPPVGFAPMPVPQPAQAYPAYPQQYPRQAYPTQTQPYPQQAYPQGPYPTQPYPTQAYPQQPYNPYYNPGYAQPYAQPGYVVQPSHSTVTQGQKHSTGLGGTGTVLAGVAGGALLGYGAARMFGGGFGMGRWGSWSSLSSIGSFGSYSSFSSWSD